MISKLPEELLHETLKHLFHISPSEFQSQPSHWDRHLGRYPRPHLKLLLLINKQWYRICTPLFYSCLELASDTAMEALASTLLATPLLGQYIRRLRLEGGYGRSLLAVVKHAPNVRVLSVQLDVLSKIPTSGLTRALPLFDPRELHLHGLARRRMNQKTEVLTEKVLAALPAWKSLVRLTALSLSLSLYVALLTFAYHTHSTT